VPYAFVPLNTLMKLRITIIITISFLLIAAAAANAAAPSLSISLDRDQATLADSINLTASIEGANGEPQLPASPAFDITRQGSSSRVQITNGAMSSSVDYSYVLYPKKEGVFTIGPATLDNNGARLTSNTVSITIQKAAAGDRRDDDVFATAEVDNKNPYVNEQIIYTFKFFYRVRVANARMAESPSFEGFVAEQLGKEREAQTTINGRQYMVTEIKQALFPVKPGPLTITASTLQCNVAVKRQRRGGAPNDSFFDDSFFGFAQTESRILRTVPLEVTVRPLPEAGKPRDFASLVGEFTAKAEISKKKLEAGESATLTLTLTGQGNLKNSQPIKLENLEGFKVYDDKPSFEQQVTGGRIGGRLVIKKALVPLKEGMLQVPPVAVAYFNPRSGAYETARTQALVLDVLPAREKEKLPAAETAKLAAEKQEIKILGKDILPIHTALYVLSPEPLNPLTWPAAILLFAPMLGFAACLAVKQRRTRYRADSGFARGKSAYKNFNKKLLAVKKLHREDDAAFYRDASKALKDFIGDKLNIVGSALTSAEIERRLSGMNLAAAHIQELKKIIELLDAGQFASRKYTAEERETMVAAMKKAAREIDRKIK
jgi:hypothetical protein